MSDLQERLRALDHVQAPEQWAEIEGRRPGMPVSLSRGIGGRFAAAAVALVVAAAGTFLAIDRLSPDPGGSIGVVDTSAWERLALPSLGLSLRYPPEWYVQPVAEPVGHITVQGAVISNVDHTFRHPDLGPNHVTSEWDLTRLPDTAVVISVETHIGGLLVRPEDLEGREPPLSLSDARSLTTYRPGIGWEHRYLPFVVGEHGDLFHVWFGPETDELDREITASVVESIAPLVSESFDGWTVDVRVEQPSSTPLTIELSPIEPAEPNDANPWIQHDVILRNSGDVPLRFEDTRRTMLLGRPEPELFAADHGCGYGRVAGGRIEWGACLAYLDTFTIPPGGIERRDVTLWKDLPGLAPLRAGEYVFEKTYRFRVGDVAAVRRVHVTFVYTVQRGV
jgi:hypothetical protein